MQRGLIADDGSVLGSAGPKGGGGNGGGGETLSPGSSDWLSPEIHHAARQAVQQRQGREGRYSGAAGGEEGGSGAAAATRGGSSPLGSVSSPSSSGSWEESLRRLGLLPPLV